MIATSVLAIAILVITLVATAGGIRTLPTTEISLGSPTRYVTTSPQGGTVYVGISDGVAVIDAATRRVQGVISSDGYGDMALSPDGRRAYLAGDSAITVLDLDGNLLLDPIPLPSATPFSTQLDISGDGRQLVVLMNAQNSTSHDVGVVDLSTGSIRTIGRVEGIEPEVSVTPDGTKAYLGGGVQGGPAVVDLRTGAVRPVRGVDPSGSNGRVVVAPDGRHAFSTGSNGVSEIDTKTDAVVRHLDRGSSNLLAVTPDSKLLLSVGFRETLRVTSLADGAPIATARVGQYPMGLSIAPDGQRAYLADDSQVEVVELAAPPSAS